MKLHPQLSGAGRYLALGIQMVVVTAVITLLGYWLDRKTGREPVFLIVFFVLGALGGLAVVWRQMAEESKPPRGPNA
jgi:F0F1-type ATP synthase assembly protein I